MASRGARGQRERACLVFYLFLLPMFSGHSTSLLPGAVSEPLSIEAEAEGTGSQASISSWLGSLRHGGSGLCWELGQREQMNLRGQLPLGPSVPDKLGSLHLRGHFLLPGAICFLGSLSKWLPGGPASPNVPAHLQWDGSRQRLTSSGRQSPRRRHHFPTNSGKPRASL